MSRSLDPDDWDVVRAQGHRMLDDAISQLQTIRKQPVWLRAPDAVRMRLCDPLPLDGSDLAEVYDIYRDNVAPYSSGNLHPGFMGWVQGGGTAVGMLADMLASGLNANLGGRNHMPIEVERQIVDWMRVFFGFPETTSGLFVTGTSIANFIALLVARTTAQGSLSRPHGIGQSRLRAYTSTAAHGCIEKACDMAGLGSTALSKIPVNEHHQIDLSLLERAIERDRQQGYQPFLVVGTAGTVDTGAIDDLNGLADLCARENLTFHIDGAYAALGTMSPELAPLLKGIERADSIAFDFHKWAQVPYDAGFVLVRDGKRHHDTFAASGEYLTRASDGLAGGDFWPCDYGPDLSRGFRALKTWFTLKTFGTKKLGAMMARSCDLARYLEKRVLAEPALELLAPVTLNIVCFRRRGSDRFNQDIVIALQNSGVAAPSTTRINGRFAIRAALFNHRTEESDLDRLVDAVLAMQDPIW